FQQKNKLSTDINDAINLSIQKLDDYYPTSDGLVYIVTTILDPYLKLSYFKENNFDSNYIKTCKQQITDLWKRKYKPNENQESNISILK
ncbi:5051_t:CDS:2, partial [Diversispora eburnea]